jgi:hypothetical protein
MEIAILDDYQNVAAAVIAECAAHGTRRVVTNELYETFYQDSVEDIAAFRAGTPIRLME